MTYYSFENTSSGAKFLINLNENCDAVTCLADANYGGLYCDSITKVANYSEVDKALAAAGAINKADYTAESWDALQAVITAVVRGYTIDKQDDVDKMAKAINDAIGALEEGTVDPNVGTVADVLALADDFPDDQDVANRVGGGD